MCVCCWQTYQSSTGTFQVQFFGEKRSLTHLEVVVDDDTTKQLVSTEQNIFFVKNSQSAVHCSCDAYKMGVGWIGIW